MTRWLLNTFTTWQLAILLVGGFSLLSVGGLLLVRRRLPELASGGNNDVGGVVVGVVAAVYGIMLAFVIVALYEDFKAAQGTVGSEATTLAQIYRDTEAFPPAVHARMRREVGGYAAAVTGDEWPRMKVGKDSPAAWRHVEDMYRVLEAYEPHTARQSAFYQEVTSKLNDLVAARRQRLEEAEEQLPTTFQVLLVGGALLLVATLYVLGMPSARTQMAMVLSVSVLTSFNLLVAVVLDHPFSGDVSVSSRPFSTGSLAELDAGLGPARGP